jgi:hypothetical protein
MVSTFQTAQEAPIAPLRVWGVSGEMSSRPTILGVAIVLASVFWRVFRQYRA